MYLTFSIFIVLVYYYYDHFYLYLTQYVQLMVMSEERRKRPCFVKYPICHQLPGVALHLTRLDNDAANVIRWFNRNDYFHILILRTRHCEHNGYLLLCICKKNRSIIYVTAKAWGPVCNAKCIFFLVDLRQCFPSI